jgi:hypothetical protein
MFNNELANINDIIITKSFESFESNDAYVFIQLSILYQVRLEYIKLLEDTFNNNQIENNIVDFVLLN